MKKCFVVYEDRYEPGESEAYFDSLEKALSFAGPVVDDGGWAEVFDGEGNEISLP